MTANELKNSINSLCTHVLFEYKGESCGVDPFNAKHFDMWYGAKNMEAHSIEEVMKSPFFDGQALEDIVDQLKNIEL